MKVSGGRSMARDGKGLIANWVEMRNSLMN
jgi:hypothetical protein